MSNNHNSTRNQTIKPHIAPTTALTARVERNTFGAI